MKLLTFLSILALCWCGIAAAPWDFDYDFEGYSLKTTILISDCSENVRDVVNMALGGKITTNCIEEPTVNQDLPHVSCSEDKIMGPTLNFTMYITDDEFQGAEDRQRLEMKVYNPSPQELKATNNTNYIYAWWFKLDDLVAPSDFFHTFQLKAVGTGVDSMPVFTFTLNDTDGFHIRVRRDDHETFDFFKMIPLNMVLEQWIQAFVETQYSSSNTEGYTRTILKDIYGNQLFPNQSGDDGKIYNNMFWDEADFVRPKWGLYRRLNDTHQPVDWQLFQNVQIWKKDE